MRPLGVPKRKARLRPAVESAVQQVRDGSFFGMHSRGHCRKHRIIEKKSPGSVKSPGKSLGNPVEDGICRETPVANTADTLSEYYTKVVWDAGAGTQAISLQAASLEVPIPHRVLIEEK